MLIDLGPEHNWCDRRCERCVLADECGVNIMVSARRAERVGRGEDPYDPEIIAADMARDMAEVMEMLVADAAERGIDLDDIELPPPSQAQRLLAKRGREFVLRAMALLDTGGGDDEAVRASMTLGAKVCRLHDAVSDDFELDPEWGGTDSQSNFVLIEQLLAAVDRGVAALGERANPDRLASFERARAELVSVLKPLSAGVTDSVREAIRDLTAAGRAPSPYCIVPD
jgi:hypothetical protein